MKILVTGNLGYVGPAVVERLRASHPEAVLAGLDIGYFGHCAAVTAAPAGRRLDVQHYADIRRLPEDVLDGVDAVVHLAAISNDPIGDRFAEVTEDVNHRASVDLARKARGAGVGAFVFASSCSMYGAAEDGPRTESSPLNPLTAYARSKVSTERDLEPLASRAFKVTSLRFSTACGWSDRLRLDLVLNDFVAGAVASREISILSDGSPWRPLIDVKDMARAVDWALSARPGSPDFLAVNVGADGANYKVLELAEAVARAIPGTQISVNRNAQPDKRSYRVDFGLYRRLAPDHQPVVGLERSIGELEAGLKAMGFKDADFRASNLVRLNVLMELRKAGLLDDRLEWTRR